MLSDTKESKNDENLKAQTEAKIFFETNFQDIKLKSIQEIEKIFENIKDRKKIKFEDLEKNKSLIDFLINY